MKKSVRQLCRTTECYGTNAHTPVLFSHMHMRS